VDIPAGRVPDEDPMEPAKDRARSVRRRIPSAPGVRVQEADQWWGGVMAPASWTSACGLRAAGTSLSKSRQRL